MVADRVAVKWLKCLSFNREVAILSPAFGAVAQLGERCVRNAEVEGSTPFRSILEIIVVSRIAAMLVFGNVL